MRIIGIVLAIVMLVSALGVDLLAASKTHHLAKQIDTLTEGMTADQKAEIASASGAPSTGRLKGGMAVSVFAALAAIVLLVSTFKKKAPHMKIASATLGLTLLGILVYPSFPTGEGEGMAPRPMMILALVLAAIGALGTWLANRRRI
jgi:hypothetical protein